MPQSLSSARFIVFGLISVFFALGVYELAPSLTPATAEEGLEGLEDETGGPFAIGQTGMPGSNARVRPILLSHRNEFVVVCVAGCKGSTQAVQVLPRPGRNGTTQVVPGHESKDVICLAGCKERPGEVVQRFQGLNKNRVR